MEIQRSENGLIDLEEIWMKKYHESRNDHENPIFKSKVEDFQVASYTFNGRTI